MIARRFLWLVVASVALLLGACSVTGSTSGPSSHAFSATYPVSATPALMASPTPGPSTDAELAAAYLGCADAFNTAADELHRQFKTATTLDEKKALIRQDSDLDRVFIECFRAISWSQGFKAAARNVLRTVVSVQVTKLLMSDAKSLVEYDTYSKTLDRQALLSSSAANLLRGDLGLPLPPSGLTAR